MDTPDPTFSLEFPSEEYQRRLDGARQGMVDASIDCLFLTSENNIRYLTGFHSQIWVSPTRPRYFVLPLRGDPICIVPASNVPGFQSTSWVKDIRSWPAPRPRDDGVTLIIEALGSAVPSRGTIGAEIGSEMRLQMPVQDFLRIGSTLADRRIVDAGPVLKRLRMIKSNREVECIKHIAEIASRAFAYFREHVSPGQSERDVHRFLHRSLIELGAERVPYLVPVSGAGGYTHINMGPTNRVLRAGDLLFIDCGATHQGYFCDFDRNFAVTRLTQELQEAYRRVYNAAVAATESIRPGRTAGEIWQVMNNVIAPRGESTSPIGRMGHGVGLDITEPPSIASGDETMLEEGMVLAVEPSMTLPGVGGEHYRLMVHEENLLVTRTGCELLTWPAGPELTII